MDIKYSDTSSEDENDTNSQSCMDTDTASGFVSFSDLIKGIKKTKTKSKLSNHFFHANFIISYLYFNR